MTPQLEAFAVKHRVPAMGAAVVTRDGVDGLTVTGVTARGGTEPAQVDDAWHIGSCGKAMTAAAYARLVESGSARWGAPLPELFADLAADLDPGWSAVTIDDLLTCQAGLPPNLTRAAMKSHYADGRPVREQRTEMAARALATPPRRPGRFVYSNLGYGLAGAAIERLTDRPYEDALGDLVLAPLGITRAGFGPPARLWGHGGPMLALGLVAVTLGRSRPADPTDPMSDNPAVYSPAGRVHLPLAEWARFHQAFLLEGGDLLSAASVERLLTPPRGAGYRMAMGWAPVPGQPGRIGQQGSNTFWVATAVMDRAAGRTALVVCNQGSFSMLRRTPALAQELLDGAA
jgi:CubicO group peptidase (beta-lactamase class C family)